MNNKEIIIREYTAADQESLEAGFREWYWPDEPLSTGFHIKTPSKFEEEIFLNIAADKGISVVATDANNKLIGFLVNSPDYPELMSQYEEQFKEFNCPRLNAFMGIAKVLFEKVNIFQKYKVDNIFHIVSLAVSPEYRGHSIGLKLFQKSFELAKSLDYKIAIVECTGVFSSAIANRSEMECIAEIEYKNYKDNDGNQIFKPPAPHTKMSRFSKVL